MKRTPESIEKEDEKKAALGEDETLVDEQQDKEAPTAPTPDETVAALTKKLSEANARADRESAARVDAEAAAATASANAGSAVQSKIAIQKTAMEGKIGAAKTNLDAIKQQLKQAKLAQDGDAEVELQDALTNARYELNVAEWEQKQFTVWEETQAKRPAATAESKLPYTAKEQAWIDAHPDFVKSKKFSRIAKVAAQEALDEGHKQDSDGYFKYIEDTLQESGLMSAAEEPLSGAGTNNSTSMAAAPNRTGTGDAPPVGKNAKYPFIPSGYRIPADWVQAAQDQGFDDPREYANMRLEEESKPGMSR